MKPAHALALVLIPLASVGLAFAATISRWVRDACFGAMVILAVVTERLDVHFVSEEWYRGTTRGIEVAFVEILAFALLAGCLLSRLGRPGEAPRWYWPASLGLLLLYFFEASISVVFAPLKLFGLFELTKIAGSILVFLAAASYLRTPREWNRLVVALAAAAGMEGLWAIKQHILTHLERSQGTLDHPNSLSMYFCLVTPFLAAMVYAGRSRAVRWTCVAAVGLATIGEVLTVSRAGLPVFFATVLGATLACAPIRFTMRRMLAAILLAAAAAAVVFSYWGPIRQRYTRISLEKEYLDPNIAGRGVYFRLARAIVEDHPFGVGLNNWSWYVSRTYGARLGFDYTSYESILATYGKNDQVFANAYLAPPAHDLGALTLGELGYPGLILFTMLWLRWAFMGARFFGAPRSDPRRGLGIGLFFSLLGIFGQSFTEWVYRQSPIFYTFYILMGALAAVTYARARDRRRAA
ncbi:MAG: O-antigen ligase family protein, partial [Opitutaceae bacterium]